MINPYSKDDMLGVEPLKLRFPYELNKKVSCSLELRNETNAHMAFNIETFSLLPYCTQPERGIVSPRSKCSINVTLEQQDNSPRDFQHPGVFVVRSTKVDDVLISSDITKDMFVKERGNVVDEVNLDVVFDAQLLEPCHSEEPTEDLSLETLNTLSCTGNLKASGVPQLSAKETGETVSEVSLLNVKI